MAAAELLAVVACEEVFAPFVVFVAAEVLAAVALLAVLVLEAVFAFGVAFVAEDFAVDVFDFGLACLLTPLGNPLESASITMDGAALLDAALEAAVLGDETVG